MATGLAAAVAAAWLDALGNASNYTAPTAFWLKLHVGDPGAAGTSNAATETTRKQVSFGAASGGAISNDVAVTWTNVAGTEDYTHWSAWDASTAGNFLCSGVITANAVTAADQFSLPIGDVDLTLNVAS
jgi:hypothetical protein